MRDRMNFWECKSHWKRLALKAWVNMLQRVKSGWERYCVCVYKCDIGENVCVWNDEEFYYASRSPNACRLEDVWLLWLAVPSVTAFKKRVAKRNVFFIGFGCQMPGIMDGTAEGKMERCVQAATQTRKWAHTYKHTHAHLRSLWAGIPRMLKQGMNNSSSSHCCTSATHTLWHTGEVLAIVSHVTLSRPGWAYGFGMLTDSRGATF